MKRLLLDTNIYGFMVVDPNREIIHKAIHENTALLIYGFEVIRKELRSVKRKVEGINLRINLLRVYDEFVKKTYKISKDIENLADNYFQDYQELGGSSPKLKIINDLLIIACASLKELDILVSNDNKTMMNELAVKAYTNRNRIMRIKLPRFVSYEEFKNELKK